MNNILKTNIKIIVLFFALTLFNCEKEDVVQAKSSMELGVTVKEYSFKAANKKLKFKEAYSKVINGNKHPENQNSKERSTSEFSIDSTTIREIEINGLTSYTMLVTNALEEDVFKNMVIQIDSSQIITAFLITYYSESLEYLDIHDSFVFQGVKAVERIDYDSSLITSFVLNDECSVVLSCGWGDFVHPAGANCTPAYIFETVECLSGGGGSTSNGGGPMTSGSDVNTPITSPVPNPKPKPLVEILECIPSLLDVSGAVNWLQENKYEVAKIKDFLQDEDGNCILENYDFALEAIETSLDGSIITVSPFIKYPVELAAEYKENYPYLTEYLKNQLPSVSEIPLIVNTIHSITGLSIEQIKEDLKWGNGPELHIVQLDDFGANTSETTVGFFRVIDPNKIYLDIDYVNGLENGTTTQYEKEALLFYLGSTILHEYVHYGDNIDGVDYPGEEVQIFEILVYGENVTSANAALILNGN